MRSLACFGLGYAVCALVACGGTVVTPVPPATDAGDGATSPVDTGAGDATAPTDATTTGDGGACAPPTDPTKAALCVDLTAEAIAFTSDPRFDGKGPLTVQVFATSMPDLADGGSTPSLASVTYTTAMNGGVDLSGPIAPIRFDNLDPSVVYVRAIFADDPGSTALVAGTWLGGYDLSGGLSAATPLLPTALVTGAGATASIGLVALRAMKVTLTRTVTPEGNGEGPATVVAIQSQMPTAGSTLFGVGKSPCARVDGTNKAVVDGFVIGKGPYYLAAVLDDFGTGTSMIALTPGALTSLEVSSAGPEIPSADELTYAPSAYAVSASVALNLVVTGDAGTDTVKCP